MLLVVLNYSFQNYEVVRVSTWGKVIEYKKIYLHEPPRSICEDAINKTRSRNSHQKSVEEIR